MLRLKARFSTLFRKSESSCSVANGVGFRFVQRCTGWSAGTRRADADKACIQGYSWKIIASRPVPDAIFRRLQPLRNAKCHNTACNSKANGSRLGGLCFRLWFWPQVSMPLHKSGQRGTQGISLEKFTKVHHGNLQSGNRFRGSCVCTNKFSRTPRRGNPHEVPSG